jgi:hypothetical protein
MTAFLLVFSLNSSKYICIEIIKEELLAFHESRDRNYLERIEKVNLRLDGLLEQIEQSAKSLYLALQTPDLQNDILLSKDLRF